MKRVGLLIMLLLLISFAAAANNPGHDGLYVEESGDSQIAGSLNISNNLKVSQRVYSDYLDIRGDGTLTGNNRIIGSNGQLQIESNGVLFLNKDISGGEVRVGTASLPTFLNVSGTIYQGNVKVCLNDGTNCPAAMGGATGYTNWRLGSNTGSIGSVGNNTLVNITAGSGITTTLSGTTITIANTGVLTTSPHNNASTSDINVTGAYNALNLQIGPAKVGQAELATTINLGSGQTIAYSSGTINANQYGGFTTIYYLNSTGFAAANITSGTIGAARGGTGLASCSDTQVLKWNGGQWTCGTDTSGVGTESDPLWQGNTSTIARAGTCAAGSVVQNTTNGGVQCIQAAVDTNSGYSQWRLGSNTGSIVAITNNTLVNITAGTGITTTLSGSTITIASTGDTNSGDDVLTTTGHNNASTSDINVTGTYGALNLQIGPGKVGATELATSISLGSGQTLAPGSGTITATTAGSATTASTATNANACSNDALCEVQGIAKSGAGDAYYYINGNQALYVLAQTAGNAWITSQGNGSTSVGYVRAQYGGIWNNNATYIHHDGSNGYLSTSAGGLLLAPESGKVSIGTNTPSARLHVLIPGTNPTRPSGNWTAIIENTIDTANNNGLVVANRWGTSGSTVFEAASYYNGATETYTPILTVKGDRNVGIGTSSPRNKLEVAGDINASGNMYSGGSQVCTAANGICATGSSTAAGWTNTTTQTTTTLNVGIGNTGPLAKLAVGALGASGMTNGSDALIVGGSNSLPNILHAVNYPVEFRQLLSTTNNDRLLFMTYRRFADNSWAGTGWRLQTAVDNSFTNYNDGKSYLELSNNNSIYLGTNGADRITISSSGNVGIGTIWPNQKLQVDGNANVTGTLYASNVSSNSPLQLQTSGTTRMYINDSTGSVGIGTITPGSKLEVNGTIRVTNDAGGSGVIIGRSDNVHEGAEIYMTGAAGYDAWYLDVYDNNMRAFTGSGNTNTFQITNSGAGTANLNVEGSVTAASFSGAGTGLTGTAASLTAGAISSQGALATANAVSGGTGGTITDSSITAADLASGDFSSKITSGTYSISITGTVSAANNANACSNDANCEVQSIVRSAAASDLFLYATGGGIYNTRNSAGDLWTVSMGNGATAAGYFRAQYGGSWNNNAAYIWHDGTNGNIATGAGSLTISPSSGATGFGGAPSNSEGWGEVVELYDVNHARLSVRANTIDARLFAHTGTYGGMTAGGTVGTTSSHPFGIMTANVNRMYFDTSGNVGIATTGPGVQAAAGRTYLTINGTSSAGVLELTTQQADADGNIVGLLQVIDTNSAAADRRIGGLAVFTDGATGNNRGGSLRFYTKSNAASGFYERARISQAGYLGIGTTAPLGPLSVGDSSVANSDGFIVIGKRDAGAATRLARIGYDSNFDFVIGDYGASNVAGTWYKQFAIHWQAPANSLYINSVGSIGINTSSPGARLHVSANDQSLALFGPNAQWGGKLYVGAAPNQGVAATAQVISTDGNLHIDPAPSKNMYLNYYQARDMYVNAQGGNVAIGHTSPQGRLDVRGGRVCISSDGSLSGCSGNNLQAGSLNVGNYNLNYGGGSNWNSNTAAILLEAADNTEIAVHDYGARLASFMYYEGANNRIYIGRNMGWGAISAVYIGDGTGKLNAGTIDPVYTINNKSFATYMAGMTGVKEETTGKVPCVVEGEVCRIEIRFAQEPEGSDLWLFAKTTALKSHISNMTVLLTPAFDGKTWYKIDAKNQSLIIYGKPTVAEEGLEISYRLAAPRFDAANWTNYNTDANVTGFVIND